MTYETTTKKQFAIDCNVSSWKVNQWCNKDFFKDLTALGYVKTQKTFTPRQTAFLKANIIEFKE
jgi:uncharacterized protein YbbC (DUF1343 family)